MDHQAPNLIRIHEAVKVMMLAALPQLASLTKRLFDDMGLPEGLTTPATNHCRLPTAVFGKCFKNQDVGDLPDLWQHAF
jgi:hypothetical protein